jgi:hypothetical protein
MLSGLHSNVVGVQALPDVRSVLAAFRRAGVSTDIAGGKSNKKSPPNWASPSPP